MTNVETYDILVFGGGKAGKTLAMDQATAGKRVAVVEAGMIGGSCINIACIPTKTLVRSAQLAGLARRAEEFGLVRTGPVSVDMGRVAARTAAVVAGMVEYNRQAFRAAGFEFVLGWGRFVEPRTIEVAAEGGARRLTGERIYLNLGTKAAIPPIPGLREAEPLTHVAALTLDVLPRRLLVIGGGYVGMELSHAFRLLGSEVVVIESGGQLAAREDADVAAAIASQFAEDGIELAFKARITEVAGRSGEQVTVRLADGRTFAGSHLLVAAGRQPMTAGIGLDLAGVELDARGFIRVDERLQTSAPDIWAMGEVAGSPMFTHVSLDDCRVAKSGIVGGARTTMGRMVPYCVFIEPEFARVGLSEKEAREQDMSYRLATLPMDVVPRARTLSERKGFMKALVAIDSDRILGFAMLGAQAGEVMAVVQMAMLGGLPFTALRDGILAHPTLAEGLNMLFAAVRPAKSQSAQNAQASEMSIGVETVKVIHVTIACGQPFEAVRDALVKNVPALDTQLMEVLKGASAAEIEERRAAGPKLWLFETRDHGALVAAEGQAKKSIQFEIGNPLTAERMTRHRLAAGLYAPLRIVLYEDDQDRAVFEYDLPSSLFDQFGDEEIAKTGCELDEELKHVLIAAAG